MTDHLRIATFNVLADSYIEDGDYRHAPAELREAGNRMSLLISLIDRLGADVIGLQEVEQPLAEALDATDQWRPFWSKKENAPDGCLLLARTDLTVDEPEILRYGQGSGYIAQLLRVGSLVIGNTHIEWELPHRLVQTQELLAAVAAESHVVLLGDFNDRPGEPARRMIAEAGYENLAGDRPTAFIANRDGPASLDLLAVRGVQAELVAVELGEGFDITEIPNYLCPSDHIPVMAQVTLPPANRQ